MELRNSVRQAVDEFLKRGDLAALFKWVNANKAAVYQSRDDDARELVDKARATIDAVLKGHIQPPEARGHLERALGRDRGDGPNDFGGPSRRLA